jgi:hypothetical protein
MKNLKILLLTLFSSIFLTNCLHITEELTLKKNGSGTYKLNFDMSEVKSMMAMMAGMQPVKDSTMTDSTANGAAAEDPMGGGGQMAEMGKQLTDVAASLKGVKGISNISEINDTATYQFGYTFDFADDIALNKALKIIGKDKYESNNAETYKFDGKKFERLAVGDFGAEIKKQLSQEEDNAEEGAESQMEMLKMFFADMTYKQIYHFESNVKKSSNELSEVSEDTKTVTISQKPFDEEQSKKNIGVATVIKLK